MTSIIPTEKTKRIYIDSNEVNVIDMSSDQAEVILDALSSDTTREIFIKVYNNPTTVSEVAEETNNSIQNTKYHFEKLTNANIIQEVGEKYSEKGNKMKIYGPKNEGIVFVVSKDDNIESTLNRSIKNLVIPIISLVIFSGGLNYIFESYIKPQISITNSGMGYMTETATDQVATNTANSTLDTILRFSLENSQIMITILLIIIGLLSILIYSKSRKFVAKY